MAQVPDLALGDQLVQRRDGFLHRSRRIGRMQLVQVDVVGLQPPQRLGDGSPDVGRLDRYLTEDRSWFRAVPVTVPGR